MKNKTKTYILLTLVLGIWGVIGYRIMSALNPTAPEMAKTNFDVSFNPKKNTALDTFSIQTSERDPFLGTLYIKKKIASKPIKTETVNWMPIIYHGTVSGQEGKNQIFVVSINSEQHLMKQGQTINDVTFIRGNKSQINLSYKGERKTINKT
ncbi:hypothetical protein SAMN05428642_103112 [Flaviramulus basaltis]|uniref:Uncharacterized protein n=1 Tax=Flaviramulus basaltis TaxID=369401 RepID=A0A1K2ILT3_9FLAO|nr:hypothetical protein [Flaviramulus basaltis]SFZ93401.1 hypothetical protein SAMN05428642_103112 [Flaviramulus basaltis]